MSREQLCSSRCLVGLKEGREKNNKVYRSKTNSTSKMWGKNVTKTCALLRALWRGLFPLTQNCHASQGSSGRLVVKNIPSRFTLDLLRQCMDKSKGIAFLGIFRWEEGAATACSWCCGFAGLPLAELLQWTPANLSSLQIQQRPWPSSAKSELPNTRNQLRELRPCSLSLLGWGQQMGAGCRTSLAEKPEGKLRNKLSP